MVGLSGEVGKGKRWPGWRGAQRGGGQDEGSEGWSGQGGAVDEPGEAVLDGNSEVVSLLCRESRRIGVGEGMTGCSSEAGQALAGMQAAEAETGKARVFVGPRRIQGGEGKTPRATSHSG